MYTKSNYDDYNYNIFRMLLQKKEILKKEQNYVCVEKNQIFKLF